MNDPISFLSLCISGVVAFLAWAAYKADSKDRRVAVKPYISFYRSANAVESSVSLQMKSSGVGPAIISEFVLLFDGRPFMAKDENGVQCVADALKLTLNEPHFLFEISPGTAFATGENLVLVKFVVQSSFHGQVTDVRAIAGRFDAIVKYRSIYEEQVFESKSADSLF